MIISKTPLRLEFLGGSTDLANFYNKYPGHVLNTSIDKYIYVTVREIKGEKSKLICNGKIESFSRVNQVKNTIVRTILNSLKINKKLEITINSDIDTRGSGLGSSGSLFVGLINALYLLKGKHLKQELLAEMACHLEIDILGAPIGKQDQYAASYGGLSLYTFNNSGKVNVKKLKLKRSFLEKLQKNILIFYTGYPHSSSKILSQQNRYFDKNFKGLKRMGDLSISAVNLLKHEDIKGFAKCLQDEWIIKKSLLGVTKNEEIERMYRRALNAGAWGGRLSGAGGGGYLYVFGPLAEQKRIIKALRGYKLISIKFTDEGSRAIDF